MKRSSVTPVLGIILGAVAVVLALILLIAGISAANGVSGIYISYSSDNAAYVTRSGLSTLCRIAAAGLSALLFVAGVWIIIRSAARIGEGKRQEQFELQLLYAVRELKAPAPAAARPVPAPPVPARPAAPGSAPKPAAPASAPKPAAPASAPKPAAPASAPKPAAPASAPKPAAPAAPKKPAAPAPEAPTVREKPAAPASEAPTVREKPAAPASEAPTVREKPAALPDEPTSVRAPKAPAAPEKTAGSEAFTPDPPVFTPKPAGERWRCAMCGCENEPGADVCDNCKFPRDSGSDKTINPFKDKDR